MKKWKVLSSVLIIGMSTVGSLFTTPVVKAATIVKNKSSVETILDNMTVEQKITQMLMPDFRNWTIDGSQKAVTEMNEDIKNILQKYEFGGVIFFAENVKETEQTAKLSYQFQTAMIENNSIPLLLTIDQEGGIVTRLGTGTDLPGNMALGATHKEEDAYDAGKIIGSELSSLGINVDFAPSIDVNNNPKNPVIGLRSFSSDPELTAKQGVAYINGIQDNGVAAAAKHFPGHGDTATDSHYGLPMVDKSYEELLQTELVPFFAASDAGVDMLMTAHIQYPQIEKHTVISKKDGQEIGLPATLSPEILTNIVRNEMKYEGIIVTDALNMNAISENFGEGEACVLGIEAGVDILLMPTILRSNNDVKKLDNVIEEVKEAVETDRISEERLDTSVTRILKLKEKLGVLDLDEESVVLDKMLEEANATVGSKENRALERKIALDAITVLDNEKNVLPLKPKSGEKVLFVTAASNQEPGTKFSIERLRLENELSKDFEVATTYYGSASQPESYYSQIDDADYVIVYTNMANESSLKSTAYQTAVPQNLFDYAKANGKKTIQVSTNKPYDAVHFSNVDATILTYGYKGMDPTEGGLEPRTAFGPNIPAAVELIFGKTPEENQPVGKLPVALPKITNGLLSETDYLYSVGQASSNWLTLDQLVGQVDSTSVRPGNTFEMKVALPNASLDLEEAKLKLTLNEDELTWKENQEKEITVDYVPETAIEIQVASDSAPKTMNQFVEKAQLIDKYGRVFDIKEIELPAIQIEQGEIEGIQLSASSLEILKKGKTLKVEVTALPTNEVVSAVDWEVQNTAIASVDASGVVTAKKAGTTRITAKTGNGQTATFTLRVSN